VNFSAKMNHNYNPVDLVMMKKNKIILTGLITAIQRQFQMNQQWVLQMGIKQEGMMELQETVMELQVGLNQSKIAKPLKMVYVQMIIVINGPLKDAAKTPTTSNTWLHSAQLLVMKLGTPLMTQEKI
jgi:hypothetical protein